jgi:Methyltransferase domain
MRITLKSSKITHKPKDKLTKESLTEENIPLLKALHILTEDGQLNQDSRRKFKQIEHLSQFITPLLEPPAPGSRPLAIVDLGAGKSYLGFYLYDLWTRKKKLSDLHIYAVESREDLNQTCQRISLELNFPNMHFIQSTILDGLLSQDIPETIDVAMALHACDTATDDAINFAIKKNAKHIVLVPCCQREMANALKKIKSKLPENLMSLGEIFRHPLHSREFGSHLTNVLRLLRLESMGYSVTVTEFIGSGHTLKNELIVASKHQHKNLMAYQKLMNLIKLFQIDQTDLEPLYERFMPISNQGLKLYDS